MRLAEIYPAKEKIYCSEHWQAWKKFRSGSSQSKIHLNVKKIRGTCVSANEKSDYINFSVLKANPNRKTYTKTRASSLQKSRPGDIIRLSNKGLSRNYINKDRFNYSTCTNYIDIIGKQMAPQALISFQSDFKKSLIKTQDFRKSSKKIVKLPTIGMPTPW